MHEKTDNETIIDNPSTTVDKKPYVKPAIEEEDVFTTYSLSCVERRRSPCVWPQNS